MCGAVQGLPEGLYYQISEEEIPDYQPKEVVMEGMLAASDIWLEYVNQYTGNFSRALTLKREVVETETEEAFPFTVHFDGDAVICTPESLVTKINDNTHEVTLKGGESVTFRGMLRTRFLFYSRTGQELSECFGRGITIMLLEKR